MMRTTQSVLAEKRGLAAALGFVVFTVAMLLLAGSMVASYAFNSRQAEQLVSVATEIQNRAESYTAALNEDLTTPQVPPTTRECSTTTKNCTQILSVTPSEDGARTVIRIQGDTQASLGQSLTQDVTLERSAVTHVTAIGDDGSNVWGLSDEGLRFTTWSVADGKPSDVHAADLVKGASWVSIDDRAGIDTAGNLWVWGANNIGQAGTGSSSAEPIEPKKISIDGVTFRAVVTEDDRAYAIDSTGHGWVWGKNDRGQLGLGTTAATKEPTEIPGKRFVAFSIGKDSAFGLTTSGSVLNTGVLTDGGTTSTTWRPFNDGTRYSDVSASTSGGVALIDDAGALTVIGTSAGFTPNPAVSKWSSVSLGGTAGYAISTDGDLYSWGTSTTGALALGSTTSSPKPAAAQFDGGAGRAPQFVSVQGGSTSVLAIDVTGQLYYAGMRPAGLYGTGATAATQLKKVLPGTTFRQVAGDSGSSVAALLDSEGNVYGTGTATKGLWPMTYSGPADQPIRMPVPDGFSSYTWEN